MAQEILGDILYETRGQVTILTINREAQRNSINTGVREGLFAGFAKFEADANARAAILTGAGDKAFCAGADLKEMSAMKLGVLPRNFLPLIGDTIEVRKPVIAAVNGVAYAGGWMFCQMCDLVVASETARFAITEAKVGRGMPWATPLTHMIPQKILLEILMTGNPVTAQRAYEFGFVNHVTKPEGLMAKALELAQTICENAPLTVMAAKQMVYTATEMGKSAALEAGRRIFEPVYQSQDAQEGPKAFAEKRKPNWQGR
ncbi:MAG: enoyl-CoA hydratase/isomerase family protein [Alphaproteobacteria bacterium]|nr:enoyl-CoA hydratase/isomerase family protein [Alphaproteobacteria bacterium]